MIVADGDDALSVARRAVEFQRRLGRVDRVEWWTSHTDRRG
jgi:hypothetical protein